MPAYTYRCLKCGEEFEVIERIEEHEKKKKHRCPGCNSTKVEQLLTPFFAKTSRKS